MMKFVISPTVSIIVVVVAVTTFLLLVLFCFHLIRRRRRRRSIPNEKQILCSSSSSENFVVPLRKFPILLSLNSNETIELSDTSTLRSIPVKRDSSPAISSDQHSTVESDVETTSTIEFSLLEYFRLEFIFKCFYFPDRDDEIQFDIVRLIATQTLIDEYFSSFSCQIRLFIGDDRCQTRKFSSKNNPLDEKFRLKIDRMHFEKSYLKLKFFGQHQDEKPLELGQTVLVLNQIDTNGENQTKFIQIYQDRIGLINRFQTQNRNATRALICLVYENDRCLVQIGLIKILGFEYLLGQIVRHGQQQKIFSDEIQIKILTILDDRILIKRKSKLFSFRKHLLTYNTSLKIDYLSLNKIRIRFVICHRRSLITSYMKPISMLEFTSINLSNDRTFQHWNEMLNEPNRPHLQWHNLHLIDGEKRKDFIR